MVSMSTTSSFLRQITFFGGKKIIQKIWFAFCMLFKKIPQNKNSQQKNL
jgi:hypothetical protein